MAKKIPDTPRISVNKLSEFARAKAHRQRQILRDQKFPTEYKGMYYREASEAITRCLASSLEDIAAVERSIKVLEQNKPDKIGTQRRVAANIDALESFLLMLDDIDMEGMTPRLGEASPPKLNIQNVEISVRPEIILTVAQPTSYGLGLTSIISRKSVYFLKCAASDTTNRAQPLDADSPVHVIVETEGRGP